MMADLIVGDWAWLVDGLCSGERVKDLKSLAYERHRFINRPANSLALVGEESPVFRLPMR